MVRKEPLHREHLAVLATLALLTVVAWVLTLAQMQGMAAMDRPAPHTTGRDGWDAWDGGADGMAETTRPDPGVRLLLYLGMWVAMMAAMMLPSAAPMILMFGTVYRTKRERGGAFVPTWVFVAGYLATWAGFGACAWAVGDFGEAISAGLPRCCRDSGRVSPPWR